MELKASIFLPISKQQQYMFESEHWRSAYKKEVNDYTSFFCVRNFMLTSFYLLVFKIEKKRGEFLKIQ